MQISDLVNQYTSAGGTAEGMTGTKGVNKLVSSLREMAAGNIFEGTVNSMKNGKVVLGLPNGHTLTARLDAKVSLTIGQSMFFQVKSNDGLQIAIRPYTVGGSTANPTLMSALQAAGIPVDGKNLSMVNSMMQEQMPIDVDSLHQMARIVASNGNINVQTLVAMQKLGIPITEELAAQFENYTDDKQAIGDSMEGFMKELPQALSNEKLQIGELRQMGGQILSIITEGLPEQALADAGETVQEGMPAEGADGAGETEGLPQDEQGQAAQDAVPQEGQGANVQQDAKAVQDSLQAATVPEGEQAVPDNHAGNHSLQALLSPKQLQEISGLLKDFPGMADSTKLFSEGKLRADSSSVEVLRAVQEAMQEDPLLGKSAITKLFSSEGMANLMRDAMEQQWMIRPEELGRGDKLSRLYEKLESQILRMENVVKAAGMENTQLTQAAADIRSNVDFMNQINQAYTYVQIPLKMNGQNASGQLYVYTNKKNLSKEGDKELTAFLHLDLDNLGSTDVSVKMMGKKVDTNFYLEDDASFALIQEHLPILEERLRKKGYSCTLTVTNENKKVNFVEDFLKKDQPSAGQLHRYSFDMRA